MGARRSGFVALGAAAAIVLAAIVLFGGGASSGYHVRLELDNASGLRKGSRVTIGGASVGKVTGLSIAPDDQVRAELALEPGHVLGSGASASIKASNLLATKFVDLTPGDVTRPAPSGVVIPNSRTTRSVDVDQVVDVLDADTRTRLGILINEAGFALTGRRRDFNTLVGRLPATLDDATRLLSEVSSDRRTLGQLVESSDQFLTRLDPERQQLGDLIRVAGDTMTTIDGRRAQLRATLNRAPRALATLRRFLVELRMTTVPLGPAARAITDLSPALTSTLRELSPFEKNARPTIAAVRETAPALTTLGTRATPVIDDAVPTLKALTASATGLAPISKTLARGGTGGVKYPTAPGAIDDLLGTATSWASGASDRDVAGHIFHGIVTVGADTLLSAVKAWSKALTPTSKAAPAARKRKASPSKQPSATSTPEQPAPDAPPTKKPPASLLAPIVSEVLDNILPQEPKKNVSALLDFLLKP